MRPVARVGHHQHRLRLQLSQGHEAVQPHLGKTVRVAGSLSAKCCSRLGDEDFCRPRTAVGPQEQVAYGRQARWCARWLLCL